MFPTVISKKTQPDTSILTNMALQQGTHKVSNKRKQTQASGGNIHPDGKQILENNPEDDETFPTKNKTKKNKKQKINPEDNRDRGFCLTHFNYDLATIHKLTDPSYTKAQYCVFQEEICPDTGKPHLQIYLYFKNPKTWKQVLKLFPKASIEEQRGTNKQAADYCKKEDSRAPNTTPTEWGTPPMDNGKQRKMETMITEILDTDITDPVQLARKYGATYIRTYRGIDQLIKAKQLKKRNKIPEDTNIIRDPYFKTYWMCGLTETGKDKTAKQFCHDNKLTLYTKQSTMGQWWSDYDDEDAILITDFRAKDMDFNEFLQFTDPYRPLEYQSQTKGGHTYLKAKYILITSDKHPYDTYYKECASDPNNWGQLHRRLTKITLHLHKDMTPIDITHQDPKLGASIIMSKPSTTPLPLDENGKIDWFRTGSHPMDTKVKSYKDYIDAIKKGQTQLP